MSSLKNPRTALAWETGKTGGSGDRLGSWSEEAVDKPCLEVLKLIVNLWPKLDGPPVVVEAGTNAGYSAATMASNGAIVHTADPVDHNFRWHNAYYYKTTFEEMMSEIGSEWDIAFLDASGNPNNDNRLRWSHYQLCRELNPSGIIIVHDTNTATWAGINTEDEDVLPFIHQASTLNLAIGKGLSVTIP